jgi:hypothetical protein
MHIVIAPCRLKEGVSEDQALETSDNFEEQFVRKQNGILNRIVVKDGEVATPASSFSTRRRSTA